MLIKQIVFAPAKSYQPIGMIVSNPQVKQLCWFNQVYSIVQFIKSSEYLCGVAQVNKWWGVRGEREREQQINGVREGALVRNGNVADWKWPLVKKDT
jgi:hypothetical protein